MTRYIDQHKGKFGVEPICQVLEVAPSTYYEVHSRSDGRAERSGLKAALDYLRPGDKLVVHSLSRLAGSVRQLLEIGEELSRRRV